MVLPIAKAARNASTKEQPPGTGTTAAERLAANAAAGKAAERVIAKELVKAGHTILGSNVGIQTSRGLRMVDHLIMTPSGELLAIEVKSGGAVRRASQLAKDAALGAEGGVIVGKNAPDFLRGTSVMIDTVEAVVP